MIIAPVDSRQSVVVTQTDHARLAADLLSLWRLDLPEHPWRDELIFATREHDNGWAESDSSPRIGPDGKPHDFMSMPTPMRQELWHRGIQRHVSERPLAAMWILRHALHLHRSHAQDVAWQETFANWRGLEDSLMEQGPWTAEEVDTGYTWLNLADTISLAACARRCKPVDIHGFRMHPTPNDTVDPIFSTITLEPLPLAGSTTFEVTARTIENRAYSSDSELALALATARWHRLKIRIGPASESHPSC